MDFKSNSWLTKNKRKRSSDFSLIVSQNSKTNTFDYYFNEDDTNRSAKRLDKKEDKYELANKLPIDWSLKNRLRFTATSPFPFEGQFKASEDATGITSFVRCIPTKDQLIAATNLEDEKDLFSPSKRLMRTPDSKGNNNKNKLLLQHHQQDTIASQLDTSHTAELRRFCFTWLYPNLPWLKLFPRIENRSSDNATTSKFNLATGTSTSTSSTSKVTTQTKKQQQDQFFKDTKSECCQQLRDDWYSSLKSLYHLVRARQCAFFYICANNFTILFRAAGVSGIDCIHAIITPTTSGLRAMLKEEGINFTMPLFDEKDGSCELNGDLNSAESNGDEASDGTDDSGFPLEEDSQIFLESLGLSQQDFPTITKSTSNKTFKDKEDKNKTLVFIKGKDTNLLLTFLSNTDIIIPTTGSLTGIPPTLLSPVAFTGASLHPLKLKTSSIMQNNQMIYNLDLIGPILPNIVYDLTKFFETTKKNFNSLIVNCDATSSFTEFSSSKQENAANLMSLFASENLKDCGLSKDLINNICQRKQQSKKILKNVQFDSNLYKIHL